MRKPVAIFAVLLKSNYPNENFILHKEAIRGLLKSDENLECTEFGAPGVSALFAFIIKKARLGPLQNKELFTVPLAFVFLHEKTRKCFFARPFDRNPLNTQGTTDSLLLVIHKLHRYFAVHIVFDWLDSRVTQVYLMHGLLSLKPVRHFVNITLLQILVVLKALIVLIVYRTRVTDFSELPVKNILLR